MTMHRRSAALGKVVRSINAPGDPLCVDIFRRPDGTYGFEEYRRDVETAEGWFPIGFHCGIVCRSQRDAEAQAAAAIGWLAEEV